MSNLMMATSGFVFLLMLHLLVAIGFYFLAEKRRKEEDLQKSFSEE